MNTVFGRAVRTVLAAGLATILVVAGAVPPGGGSVASANAPGEPMAPTWLAEVDVPYDALKVVQRALHHHAGVRIAQLQYAAAQARGVESRAALRPALSVDVRPYWLSGVGPDLEPLEELLADFDWEDLGNADRREEALDELRRRWELAQELIDSGLPEVWHDGRGYSVVLSGRVPLWRSPLQQALETIASVDDMQADADLEAAVGMAVVQSLEAYYGVLRAEAALRLAELALDEVRLRADEIAARLAAGTATRVDELQVEAELHQAEARVIQARGEAAAARLGLNQMLGFPPETRLHVVEMDIPAAWPELDEAIELSARRADVQRAQNDLEKAKAAATIAREQAALGVRVFGQYRWSDGELAIGVDRQGYLGGSVTHDRLFIGGEQQEGEAESWTAGVEVSWPIFDGHQRRAQVAHAELQVEQAALGAEQLYRTAVTEVTAAYARLEAAEQALDGARRGVAAAEEAVRVAEELATAGAATERDVLRARMGLAQAEMGRLEATYAFTLAQAAYLQAAGVLLPHWLALVGLDQIPFQLPSGW